MNEFYDIDSNTTIFWFRRDLRLEDNAGLYYSLRENRDVLPLFIFDTEILERLEDKCDKRVVFIYQNLKRLKKQLEEFGSSLLILHGNPREIFRKIRPKLVYANRDYEPYARSRDEAVALILRNNGSELREYKDQVVFEKSEIV